MSELSGGTVLEITQVEFDALLEYNSSLPTWQWHEGKLLGTRMWKRQTPEGWRIGKLVTAGATAWIAWFIPGIVEGAKAK